MKADNYRRLAAALETPQDLTAVEEHDAKEEIVELLLKMAFEEEVRFDCENRADSMVGRKAGT